MPEFFTFLLKVNIALVLFCMGYYVVLGKLTFYTLNRAYLITAILFSSVYPFIDLSVLAQQHQDIVAPVQNVVIIWKAPAEQFVKQAAYWNWLEIAFWTGVAVFAARLLFQMVSLYRIYAKSTVKEINGQTVRVVKGDISPFSFWKSIYVNPDKLSTTDLKNVLAHEQVHVDEWHTLDILLTEISVIFYWFNPGIWMMKRAVRENIEFITDRKILQKGMDSKVYQYSLLNITFNQPAPAITSNFNFSTLKKRIQMMNAKRSSKITLTRYAFLVPVVVVCLFTFSLSKAEAVKTSPALKAVAEAVNTINNAVLNIDTIPATKTATGTTTVKKVINGTTITLTGADVKNFTYKIDSSGAGPQKVTVKGKMNGKEDSIIVYTYGDKPSANYRFNVTALDRGTETTSTDAPKSGQVKEIKGLTYFGNADTSKNSQKAFGLTTTVYGYSIGRVDAKPATTRSLKPPAINVDKLTEVTVIGRPMATKSIVGSADTVNKIYKVVEGNPIRDSNGLWRVTTDASGKQTSSVQPLFVVDGKEVDQKDLKSFEGNVVYLTPETAILKYGKKGENGALVITTKKK
jgi:bla regulator protein blaR1